MNSALDSIIDAIECNRLKLALDLCEKSLKKWPGNLQVNALKSLALWYAGNEDEAETLAVFSANKQPKDHFTISVIERVLEFTDHIELLASVCENALQYDYDIRVAEKLFFAYLKLQNTKKLYSITSKLFNISKNYIYLYWTIVGLIIDNRSLDRQDNSIIPELSKRILSKITTSFSSESLGIEYKNIRFMVHEISNDYSGIIHDFETDKKGYPSEYILSVIKAYTMTEKLEEAKRLCISQISSSSFIDSSIWESYLNILKQLDDFGSAIDTLESLSSKMDMRGLKCASIELKLIYSEAFLISTADMLLEFTSSLRSKPSTFNDVIFFLKKMNEDDVEEFYLKISQLINSTTSRQDIIDRSIYLHIHRYLSMKLNKIIILDNKVVQLLDDLYSEIDSLNGASEFFYSLALYRCLCEVDSINSGSSGNDLSKISFILTNYSKLFVDNYVFGLLKIFISLKCGNFDDAYRNFKNLEIKCLQLDTLGYIISDHAINLFAFPRFESFRSESSSLYVSNRRDTWGLICQSFEDNSFTSVIDFYEFYNRLERSVQNISIHTNCVKMNILQLPLKDLISFLSSKKVSKSVKILSYALEGLVDNRDYEIFDSIDATGNLKNQIKFLNFFEVEEACYYYHLLNLFKPDSDNVIMKNTDSLSSRSENSLFAKMMVLIHDTMLSEDLVTRVKILIEDLIANTKIAIQSFENTFINYEVFKVISNFLLKFKELMLIAVLKFRKVKDEDNNVNVVLSFMKTQLSDMKFSFNAFFGTLKGITEEHSNSFNLALNILETMQNEHF